MARRQPLPLFTDKPLSVAELRELQAAQQSEGETQRQIRDELGRLGWLVVRINGGGWYDGRGRWVPCYDIPILGGKGHPDLVAYRSLDGATCQALFIEVKRRGGKLRASQQRFLEMAEQRGIQVHVCDSWEQVQQLIQSLE